MSVEIDRALIVVTPVTNWWCYRHVEGPVAWCGKVECPWCGEPGTSGKAPVVPSSGGAADDPDEADW